MSSDQPLSTYHDIHGHTQTQINSIKIEKSKLSRTGYYYNIVKLTLDTNFWVTEGSFMEEWQLVRERCQCEVVTVREEMGRGRTADADQKEYNSSMSVTCTEAEIVVGVYTERTMN